MKSLSLLSVSAIAAAAVCCSRTDTDIPLQEQMLVLPQVTTKAPLNGGAVPDDYTIYLSGYFNNTSSERSSGNYLTAEPFRKDGGTWCANPPVYWPLGGHLDFLALASQDMDIAGKALWYGDNVSRSVQLEIMDGSCLDSEVLYAKTSSRDSERCIPLEFLHTQSWVRFQFRHHAPGTVRIDSIVICKAYLGGVVRIDNDVFLDCGWDFHGHFRKDHTIAQSRGLVLGEDETGIDLLLPEQNACSFKVYYTQKKASEPSWEDCLCKECYTAEAIADPWYRGTKTVYTMTILKKIMLTTDVCGWSQEDKPITIQ